MTTSEQTLPPKSRYHSRAYDFVRQALEYTQMKLGRHTRPAPDPADEQSHVSGKELLNGFRELAYHQFGALALTVFHHWGLNSTNDVGLIVWDLIERGEMRKTDRDQLSDFYDLYDFGQVFDADYPLDVRKAFEPVTDSEKF